MPSGTIKSPLYPSFHEKVTFPKTFDVLKLNKFIKARLLVSNFEVPTDTFIIYINELLLKATIEDFLKENNLFDEDINDIIFDSPVQLPTKYQDIKCEETINDIKINQNLLLGACLDVQIFDIYNSTDPIISIPCKNTYNHVEWLDYDSSTGNGSFVTAGSFCEFSIYTINTQQCSYKKLYNLKNEWNNYTSLDVDNDKNLVVSGNSNGFIEIWSSDINPTESDNLTPAPPKKKYKKNFNPDYSTPIRSPLLCYKGTESDAYDSRITDVTWCNGRGSDNSQKHILSVGNDFYVKLWKIAGESGTITPLDTFKNLHEHPTTVTTNKSNTQAIVTCKNLKMHLFDISNGSLCKVHTLEKIPKGSMRRVVWCDDSHDTYFLTGSNSNQVKLWDTRFLSKDVKVVWNGTGNHDNLFGLDVNKETIAVSYGKNLMVFNDSLS